MAECESKPLGPWGVRALPSTHLAASQSSGLSGTIRQQYVKCTGSGREWVYVGAVRGIDGRPWCCVADTWYTLRIGDKATFPKLALINMALAKNMALWVSSNVCSWGEVIRILRRMFCRWLTLPSYWFGSKQSERKQSDRMMGQPARIYTLPWQTPGFNFWTATQQTHLTHPGLLLAWIPLGGWLSSTTQDSSTGHFWRSVELRKWTFPGDKWSKGSNSWAAIVALQVTMQHSSLKVNSYVLFQTVKLRRLQIFDIISQMLYFLHCQIFWIRIPWTWDHFCPSFISF